MKELKITVSPEGAVQIETSGFTGTACKDFTKSLEAAIGTVTSDTPTPEAFQREESHNRDRA